MEPPFGRDLARAVLPETRGRAPAHRRQPATSGTPLRYLQAIVTRSATRLAAAALSAGAVAGAVPATAAAASLTTDRACYTRNQTIHVSGSGYTPGSTQTVFLDGAKLGVLTPTSSGAVGGVFSAPAPFASKTSVRTYGLVASSSPGGNPVTARTSFQVVHTNVGVSPPFITPGRVRYKALGFTYGHTLYVHYLRGTKHVATKRVGSLHGSCGRLNKRVRMFLFRPVKPATYTLIFDNSRTYSATFRPNFSFQAVVPFTFS
jgi:hypothetical protein